MIRASSVENGMHRYRESLHGHCGNYGRCRVIEISVEIERVLEAAINIYLFQELILDVI